MKWLIVVVISWCIGFVSYPLIWPNKAHNTTNSSHVSQPSHGVNNLLTASSSSTAATHSQLTAQQRDQGLLKASATNRAKTEQKQALRYPIKRPDHKWGHASQAVGV